MGELGDCGVLPSGSLSAPFTVTSTFLDPARSLCSHSHTPCHVPRFSLPSDTGTVRLEPRKHALTCAGCKRGERGERLFSIVPSTRRRAFFRCLWGVTPLGSAGDGGGGGTVKWSECETQPRPESRDWPQEPPRRDGRADDSARRSAGHALHSEKEEEILCDGQTDGRGEGRRRRRPTCTISHEIRKVEGGEGERERAPPPSIAVIAFVAAGVTVMAIPSVRGQEGKTTLHRGE